MSAIDTRRRLQNLIALGTIASVDLAAARVTVTLGDITTAPLPWLAARAGTARTWWAPTVGEQVVVLSPDGDPAQGVVLTGVYATAHPAPDETASDQLTVYPDGASIRYSPESHTLTATLPAGGKANLTADGGVHVTGDTTITGKLHVTSTSQFDADMQCAATLTASADVVGGGVSLKNHIHGGVTAGDKQTGKPA